MQDTYVPAPAESTCPHCDRRVLTAPILRVPGSWAASHYLCLGCREEWFEIRDPITTTRYWEPVQVPLAESCLG